MDHFLTASGIQFQANAAGARPGCFLEGKNSRAQGHDAIEPVGSIHMPSATVHPFLMSVGIFIAGLGFMFSRDDFGNSFMSFLFNNYIVTALGLLITFGSMLMRSLFDDHGWHIEPEELEGR